MTAVAERLIGALPACTPVNRFAADKLDWDRGLLSNFRFHKFTPTDDGLTSATVFRCSQRDNPWNGDIFVRKIGTCMSLFDDMAVFVRAVEAGSFSGAAQRLGIAKSIVSRRISSLETRLGASLFHRTTRRLSLTETGMVYFERARRILSDVAEADDVARQLQGELKGKLRVAAPMSFGWRHLSPAIVEFLTAHPQLDIDLDLNDRRVELVSEGYDLAIRIGKLEDSSLITRTLAPCPHVVCASPAYLAARGVPVTPSDLVGQNHDCLVYSNRPASEQWRFRVDDEWKGAPIVARRLTVNNGDVLREAAIAGLGLVVLPTFLVGDAVAAGTLRILLPEYEFFDPAIHAIWPPNRQLSTKVRALVDFLTERFGGTPYWDRPLSSISSG